MSLARFNRGCRAAACTSMALLLLGCDGDGGSFSPASVAVVSAASAPTSTPTPTPTSTPTTTPTPEPETPDDGSTAVIVQSGDSIGIGLGADDWAAINHLGFAASVVVHNTGVPGKAMEAGYGMRATELFPFWSSRVPSILVIQQGTNDLYYGISGSLLYQALLRPFVDDAHAAGFYVVVDTVLPRADSGWTPVMEQQRMVYNALVRANSAKADAINDVAADPVMGDGTNPATSTYYADALHPSLMGQQRLATLDAAVIGPFLQRSPRTRAR